MRKIKRQREREIEIYIERKRELLKKEGGREGDIRGRYSEKEKKRESESGS